MDVASQRNDHVRLSAQVMFVDLPCPCTFNRLTEAKAEEVVVVEIKEKDGYAKLSTLPAFLSSLEFDAFPGISAASLS